MDIRPELRAYLAESILFTDRWEYDDDTSFLEGEILDSTGILELVSFLERTVGIEIPDADIVPANLDSVTAVAAYVTARLAQHDGAASRRRG